MTQPGYNAGNESVWWWKVAMHLDEAQLALANAMAHNVDDPGPIPALHDRLREGQAILLEIFRAKGLLPASTNGVSEPPTGDLREPMVADGEPAVAIHDAEAAVTADPADEPTTEAEVTVDAAAPEAAAVSNGDTTVAPPEVVAPPAPASDVPSPPAPTDPSPGGAVG